MTEPCVNGTFVNCVIVARSCSRIKTIHVASSKGSFRRSFPTVSFRPTFGQFRFGDEIVSKGKATSVRFNAEDHHGIHRRASNESAECNVPPLLPLRLTVSIKDCHGHQIVVFWCYPLRSAKISAPQRTVTLFASWNLNGTDVTQSMP